VQTHTFEIPERNAKGFAAFASPAGTARYLLNALLAAAGFLFSVPVSGQYSLDSFGIGPGGDSAGGGYSLHATIEDAQVAETISGGTYSLETGFWAVTAVPTPGAPRLAIHSTPTNTVVVSWPASADGFELRQSSSLNPANWIAPAEAVKTPGGNKFIIVHPSPGHIYYRLASIAPGSAFQVVNLNDAGPGSLRAAIQSATNTAVVTFAPGLAGSLALNGELVVNKDLTIAGPGATVFAVSGGNSTRVFNITGGNVKISGLTIRDGVVTGAGNGPDAKGGGIFNAGNLTLSDCALVANVAAGGNGASGINANGAPGGSGAGGGIYSTGALALVNCTLALNEARGGTGGRGSDSTGNSGFAGGAGGNGQGGGLCNDGVLTITNCTFAFNRVTGGQGGDGGEGGLFRGRGGNGGAAEGAGALNRMSCQAANVTITGGTAERGLSGAGTPNGTIGTAQGGGLRNALGTATLVNALIARNTLGSSITVANGFDVSGAIISQGYNLVGMTNGSTGWMASDKKGNDVLPLDPMIGVLQDNGGGTPTIALLPGSPAIDQGKNAGVIADQRGFTRPFDVPSVSNAAGGDASDMGAFEFVP
jgi:hypothetical protein